MTKFADLHIHTHFSDSTLSPQNVVDEALKCGLSCIGIVDHDTAEGVEPAILAAEGTDLEVIAGIELSSEIHGKDMHILGYLIDHRDDNMQKALAKIQETRVERIKKIIHKLKEQGIDNISPEEVFALAESDAVGRPHLATVLVQKGWVSSISEAFNRYLADGRPACVRKFKMSPYEAINLIEEFGGIAVLAHPMVAPLDELIPDLVKAGLKGIEAFYPNSSPTVIQYYEDMAKKYDLIVTGGSDAHGEAKKNTFMGKVKIPYAFVERLKELKR